MYRLRNPSWRQGEYEIGSTRQVVPLRALIYDSLSLNDQTILSSDSEAQQSQVHAQVLSSYSSSLHGVRLLASYPAVLSACD